MTQKLILLCAVLALFAGHALAQRQIRPNESVTVNKDLEITRITDHGYVYTAWEQIGEWGRVGCNGMVIVSDGKAFLMDTPMSESQTIELASWFDRELGVRFESFAPGHWHEDCVGGLPWLNRQGVKTYALDQTNAILASQKKEQAKDSFKDSLTLSVGDVRVELYFLGGGHATDNIVGWIPSEKILFGGCMLKDLEATNIGNTSDAAPLDVWRKTVGAVEQQFPDARIIIPGHGKIGGKEIFTRTKEIIEQTLSSPL